MKIKSGLRRRGISIWLVALVAGVTILGGLVLAAQGPAPVPDELRRQIEQRYDVLPLRDGVALRPKVAGGVKLIEVTNAGVAIDGIGVTGAEVRSKLGDDADAVLQLSYFNDAALRSLTSSVPSVSATPDPAPTEVGRNRSGRRETSNRIRFGGPVEVAADEVINGDVVGIGGPVRVFGEVRGEVVAIGGGLELGPEASVSDDVTVIGGALKRAPTAHIGGKVEEIGAGAFSIDGDLPSGSWRRWVPWVANGFRSDGFALLASVARGVLLCLFALLVVLLGGQYVTRVGTRAAAQPMKAGAIGLLSQLLLIPVLVATIIFLVITIVGIPLLLLIPFALIALILAALVGYTAVARHIGEWLAGRFGWSTLGPYAVTAVGVVALLLPFLTARLVALAGGMLFPITMPLLVIGGIAEYLAWTIGFGAVMLVWFAGRSRAGALTPARADGIGPPDAQ